MRMTVTRALLALLLLGGACAALGACNTVAGAGQDLENGSHDVQQHL